MTFANKIARMKSFKNEFKSRSFNFLNSFLASMFFNLFVVIFMLRLDNLASKSVFVIKLACSNLALKEPAAKVSNSGVVIYLS